MKLRSRRSNSPTKFWGITDWDDWWKHVVCWTPFDGIRCDSEVIRVDTYRVKVDDEDEG
jgi:hypothetical protein